MYATNYARYLSGSKNINENVIMRLIFKLLGITAAHCAEKIPDLPNLPGYPGTKLVFGSNDISRSSKSHQKFGVKRIILHPDYSTDFIIATADVALLELKQPAVLSDYVNLPCMHGKDVYPSKKSFCYFAGMILNIYLFLLWTLHNTENESYIQYNHSTFIRIKLNNVTLPKNGAIRANISTFCH